MNVLYIGNYKDTPNGWSNASQYWIKSLNKATKNLAIRYYKYSMKENNIDISHLRDLEKKRFDAIDIIIQNILPTNMQKYNGAYNIGICYFESNGVLSHDANNWRANLQQMDEVWVSTQREYEECIKNNIRAFIIPQSIDLWTYKKHEGKNILGPSKNYRFYNIGGDGVRKNLQELVLGYCIAFSEDDDVELILKCGNRDYVNNVISTSLKLVPDRQPRIQLIFDDLSDDQILSIHKECNCFVSTSSEESISRPLMDACALGRPAIVTAGTSMQDIRGVEIFPSFNEFCLVNNPPVRGIYTYREDWLKPTVKGIAETMRRIFDIKKTVALYDMLPYDCNTVARLISERIDAIKEHNTIKS